MRKLFAAFALLAAAVAGAQTVDPHEETYGPFAPGHRDRQIALAGTPAGILVAWSEIVEPGTQRSAIHTALLDFNARLVGEVRRLPSYQPDNPATTPAIVTNGQGFLISWAELAPYSLERRYIIAVLTDAHGNVTSGPHRLGNWVGVSPAIVFDGLVYRVYGERTYTITHDGQVTSQRGFSHRRIPFATPEANGWVDWGAYTDWFAQGRTSALSLNWSYQSAYDSEGGFFQAHDSYGPPAVAAEGRNLLIVWSTDDGLEALRVNDGRPAGRFRLDHAPARKSIPALSGQLVVFESNGDILGSIINGDDFGAPFPISTGEAHDTDPRVLAVGYGRYLVAYVRDHGNGTVSLAARFVKAP